MSPFSHVIGLLTVLATGEQASVSTRPTLIDLARQHPGTESARLACGYVGNPPTLESIVREAEFIVHGSVVAADGRLSADAHDVWTDYQVQPIQIIREQMPPLPSSPFVFTALGGTVIVEGLLIKLVVRQNGREVSMKPGDEVILLGTRRDEALMLHPTGVFVVQDGKVHSNGDLPGFSEDQRTVPLETFLTRVRDIHR